MTEFRRWNRVRLLLDKKNESPERLSNFPRLHCHRVVALGLLRLPYSLLWASVLATTPQWDCPHYILTEQEWAGHLINFHHPEEQLRNCSLRRLKPTLLSEPQIRDGMDISFAPENICK